MMRFGMTWAMGSTITVLHDVGDDNNRERTRKMETGLKVWLAG